MAKIAGRKPKGKITWDEVGPIIARASGLIQAVVRLVAPPFTPAEVAEVIASAEKLTETVKDALLD